MRPCGGGLHLVDVDLSEPLERQLRFADPPVRGVAVPSIRADGSYDGYRFTEAPTP